MLFINCSEKLSNVVKVIVAQIKIPRKNLSDPNVEDVPTTNVPPCFLHYQNFNPWGRGGSRGVNTLFMAWSASKN